MDVDDLEQASVTGKRVMVTFGGVLTPQLFGTTTFTLEHDRLVETSTGLVARQKCQIPLAMISAMAVTTQGNPLFLVFGFLTLPLFGLGLVFIVLYFLLPRNFLVVHSNNYITALNCRGDLDRYRSFADMATQAAINTQTGSGEGNPAPVPRAAIAVAAPAVAATVRCPGCGTEYRLPPGAAGRRLRCQKCQSVVG